MNIFDVVLINPILNLLVVFYKALTAVGLPGALGFSIILLTTAIRLLLWPLTTSQLKSAQKMASLKPHLDQIKSDHGHDKVKHQQEVSKLYKEHGVNPAAGCLPLILQIPIFIALYQSLLKIVHVDSQNFLSEINSRIYLQLFHLDKVPDVSFFGLNLTAKPNEWREVGIAILLIPLLTGLLQFVQSKMMSAPKKEQIKSKGVEKAAEGMEDTMAQVQSQMTFIMPAMIAFFSYGFPLGLSLYWNTFTVIGIIQQYVVAGAGSLNKYLPKSLQKNTKDGKNKT